MFGLFRYLKRRRLAKRPFPEHWITILEENLPAYNKYPVQERARFRQLLKIFAWEKHFIGVKGMEISDRVRVLISASAVRLIRFLDMSYYDRLTEILVYPYVYKHAESDGAILGEAHTWGTVVLSWPAVEQGLADPKDGHDTAMHEFAHVLDRDGGSFNGTPDLRASDDYSPWAQVMSKHFLRLQERKKTERKVMRMYGATNEAEFFAVATESYFEKGEQMKKLTPELYQEMQDFYGGDPAAFEYDESDVRRVRDIGRNDPCPCGSKKKFKKCCGRPT